MMNINLIPEKERASLKAIQLGTILFVIGMVLITTVVFASVYIKLQVISETDRLTNYETTMASLTHYRTEATRLQQELQQIGDLMVPLNQRLAENESAIDVASFFNRITTSAQAGHVWLKELSIQKDGSAPISGYAVESSEVSRFLKAVGQHPFHVVMGSTRWVERDGVRLIEFNALVTPVRGVQP